MPHKLFLLLLFFFSIETGGQGFYHEPEEKLVVFSSRKNDQKVQRFLKVQESIIRIVLHPFIQEENLDSLISLGIEEAELSWINLGSESTEVFLKDSYHWEIGDELPEIPIFSTMKYLLKNNKNLSRKERSFLNYWEFNSNPSRKYIDKFIRYQRYKLRNGEILQVKYEIRFPKGAKTEVKVLSKRRLMHTEVR